MEAAPGEADRGQVALVPFGKLRASYSAVTPPTIKVGSPCLIQGRRICFDSLRHGILGLLPHSAQRPSGWGGILLLVFCWRCTTQVLLSDLRPSQVQLAHDQPPPLRVVFATRKPLFQEAKGPGDHVEFAHVDFMESLAPNRARPCLERQL